MRAGAERLERETLRRDSKLWTCRRAAAALCEFAIAQCPALFLSECETASIQKISGRFEFAFRARRRRCASTRQRGTTADACRSVAHGTEKIVRIARECQSMIRKSMPSGHDPMGGYRFSEKDLAGRPRKHRFHLGLQGGGVERLDDVVADPGLLRGDDVFGF